MLNTQRTKSTHINGCQQGWFSLTINGVGENRSDFYGPRERILAKIREAEIEAKYHPESISYEDFNAQMKTLLDRIDVQ